MNHDGGLGAAVDVHEPPEVLVTIECCGVVLGGYYSERATTVEFDGAGGICADVITEEGTGARVLFHGSDVAGCAVTDSVVALKLRGCSGFAARYINPDVEESATVVLDPGGVWSPDLRAQVAAVCLAQFAPMDAGIADVLHCKLRLMKAQRQAAALKAALAQHRGDSVKGLSDAALAAQQVATLAAIRAVSMAVDARASEQLAPHLCVCCTTAPSTVLLNPCQHLALCEGCFKILIAKQGGGGAVSCPVCRTDAFGSSTVYLP